MIYTRYAIYMTLPPGPLASFGAAWLGWDAAAGAQCPHPDIPGLPAPVQDLTATPRKYGLHGTIKAPFRLAAGASVADLETALVDFCMAQSTVTLDGLALTRLGSFLALTPTGNTNALSRLAANAVQQLDSFRAPPDPAERARRKAANLTDRQHELLTLYGYPYVMEAFRFHITLTGKLPRDQLSQTESALRPRLEKLLPQPFQIDALTLCGEASSGNFHEVRRVPLSG